MAFPQAFPAAKVAGERAEQAWRLPMGAVSPLWAVFGAAASVGVAYWWMTQWTRSVNIEALGGVKVVAAPKPAPPEIVAELAPVPAPAPAVEAPVVVAAPEPAPLVEAPPALPDDLTRMVGIGPKLAASLAARGVSHFADIAAWTEADLAEVDTALSLKGRAVREAWVAQARRLTADA
jgi:predicted flap endonuclease-1-like 5' DNA nuclease